jgi:hypothetical protein
LDEVEQIKAQAEAFRFISKNSKQCLKLQNEFAEVRIRAERRGGEILQDMRANNELESQGGDRKSKCPKGILNLAKIGITPKESSRFKKIAEIPEKTFEGVISEIKDQDQELTTALFLSICRRSTKEQQEKKKEKTSEFRSYLHKAWMRAETLSKQIGDILDRKNELKSESIWDSDDRRDLCRVLGLLVDIGQDLLDEVDAIGKSKDKTIIDTEVISEASVS